MNKKLTAQLVNQIINKNFIDANNTFNSLIKEKALKRLNDKKVEIASKMFVSENETLKKPLNEMDKSTYDNTLKEIIKKMNYIIEHEPDGHDKEAKLMALSQSFARAAAGSDERRLVNREKATRSFTV